MKLSQNAKQALFDKTDGRCHLCHKKLVFTNYGIAGAKGAWEKEHSKARAKGGTDHANNLFAACIPCNRSKQDQSTYAVRSRNGVKGAPRSRKKRESDQLKAGLGGAASGALLGFRVAGPVGGLVGCVVGYAFGAEIAG
ncbi:MAG: HNH endonuclease [Gammaproteobacteria bacterium]